MKTSMLRRHASVKPSGRGVALSALDAPYRAGRTMFPSRVFDPDEVQRVLKDGHQSRKIGKTVQKGRLKDAPIYTLTLEERATCPRSCVSWAYCYGNNMQAAERIVAGAELEAQLWSELEALQHQHPGGFLVRLHVLGDFYSIDYVNLWRRALIEFPALHVFGFSARLAVDPIGQAVEALITDFMDRWRFRFSGRPGAHHASRIIDDETEVGDAVLCPAQTGKTDCCATCALCWSTTRTIAFLRH